MAGAVSALAVTPGYVSVLQFYFMLHIDSRIITNYKLIMFSVEIRADGGISTEGSLQGHIKSQDSPVIIQVHCQVNQ